MDFIELNYTGKADGKVFDTTLQKDAPKGSKGPFEPTVVKLGIGQLLPGLDEFLKDKKPGSYQVFIDAEHGFGPKDSKLLKLVPLTAFGKESKDVGPGVPVTIGQQQGTVKSVSGGRVVVDFNHPLAGKDLQYDVELIGEVTDKRRKVDSILKALLGVALPVTEEEEKVVVTIPKGFPGEGLVKELEKHTGVTVTLKEIELSNS